MYVGRPFDSSDSLYWLDINFNITKKINKQFNFILSYYHIQLNNDVAKISNDAKGIIKSHIAVLELGYKINSKHSIRTEFQGLFLEKDPMGKVMDKGNWATWLVEYNISPNWFFSFMLQNNYGNPKTFSSSSDRIKATNYPILTCGYIRESTRFMVSYGRQRAGLFCVGGVCRFVPASNGLTLSFTHSF
jgi:LysM repeat protein